MSQPFQQPCHICSLILLPIAPPNGGFSRPGVFFPQWAHLITSAISSSRDSGLTEASLSSSRPPIATDRGSRITDSRNQAGFSNPQSAICNPQLSMRRVEFLQLVHMQLFGADDLFQPEDQRGVALSRFPRLDVAVERIALHLQIVPEHLREVFSLADFGRLYGRRPPERNDLVAQVLRMHVRFAARTGEELGELLTRLPCHQALLLQVLDRRRVFQRQHAIQPCDQLIAIAVAVAPVARALAVSLLHIFFTFSHFYPPLRITGKIMNRTYQTH